MAPPKKTLYEILGVPRDANPLDKPGLANFTAAMLDEGTATRNALQIADEVAQLGASLGISSSMDATTLAVRSLSKNFASTIDLLADVTLHPSFPAQEIERQRAKSTVSPRRRHGGSVP